MSGYLPAVGAQTKPSRSVPTAPPPSSLAATAVMRGNRKKDTRPEVQLRSVLHRRGMRFFKNTRPERDIPCQVDVVFPRARLAVFVDGCFWHGCREHGTAPKTNARYWSAKIARNIERDRENDELLLARGWRVIRVWEHEPVCNAADRVEEELRGV